jgi:hypothetical protein
VRRTAKGYKRDRTKSGRAFFCSAHAVYYSLLALQLPLFSHSTLSPTSR